MWPHSCADSNKKCAVKYFLTFQKIGSELQKQHSQVSFSSSPSFEVKPFPLGQVSRSRLFFPGEINHRFSPIFIVIISFPFSSLSLKSVFRSSKRGREGGRHHNVRRREKERFRCQWGNSQSDAKKERERERDWERLFLLLRSGQFKKIREFSSIFSPEMRGKRKCACSKKRNLPPLPCKQTRTFSHFFLPPQEI